MTAPFHVAEFPLPWEFAVQVEDGGVVYETATDLPVARWRTQYIVPAPGRTAATR